MAVKRLWFYLKLYPYFVSRSIQSRMSYKSDFILGVTASALMQALGYVFIWAVFQGIPEMNGWSFYQMVFVYGMSAISLGLNEFLFAGSWQVGKYVREGSFDRLLLRPVGTMFSILAADVALHGLGSVLFGLAVCIVALCKLQIVLSLVKILFWIVAMACGALIFFAVNMICATIAFWVTDTSSAMVMVQNVSEFTKYPIAIYGRKLQVFLTYVIPFAFSSYYPAGFLLGMEDRPIYWLGPVMAAALAVTAAALFWRYGTGKYQSAGG